MKAIKLPMLLTLTKNDPRVWWSLPGNTLLSEGVSPFTPIYLAGSSAALDGRHLLGSREGLPCLGLMWVEDGF